MKIKKGQGTIKTNFSHLRVTYFLHHKYNSFLLWRPSVNIYNRNWKLKAGLPLSLIRHLTEFMRHFMKRWAKLRLYSI